MSMPKTYDENGAALIPCDQCGEDAATVHLTDASLCDDCAPETLSEILEPHLGFKPCARLIWQRPDTFDVRRPAICCAPYGIEHDHAT